MRYYYTADLHFGHKKIIEHCHRPFSSTDDMDNALISNINKRCKKDDVLFILGDVAWYGNESATSLLKRIKSKKILVKGNHDASLLKSREFRNCFVDIVTQEMIHDGNKKIFLSHYPMAEWDGYYKGIWHFYGHIHNSQNAASALMEYVPTAVNVGVDVQDFVPKTADELISERIENYQLPDPSNLLQRTVYLAPEERQNTRTLDLGSFKNIKKIN